MTSTNWSDSLRDAYRREEILPAILNIGGERRGIAPTGTIKLCSNCPRIHIFDLIGGERVDRNAHRL